MMQGWADYVDALRDNTDLATVNRIGRESVVAAMKTIHSYEAELLNTSLTSTANTEGLDQRSSGGAV